MNAHLEALYADLVAEGHGNQVRGFKAASVALADLEKAQKHVARLRALFARELTTGEWGDQDRIAKLLGVSKQNLSKILQYPDPERMVDQQ